MKNRYSLHFYPKAENPKWDDRYQLRKISPYDEAEYYWAYTYNKKNWVVVFEGRRVFTKDNKTEAEMIEFLEKYNQKTQPSICHN